jgi:hypothetical protein
MAETIVRPAAPTAFERFGSSLASHRDTLVVGADGDGTPGRAYVFVWNGSAWVQQARLQPSDSSAYDYFGTSIALDADCLVVGAKSGGPDGDGQAYVFRRTGSAWTEEAILTASTPGPYGFGQSVAIHGDELLVGGFQAAYFFRRAGAAWTETAKVTSPAPNAGGRFGGAVALHGDHAVVGDEWEGGAALHHGSACIYRRAGATWDPVLPVLTAPDATAYDHFGRAVAIHGDRLIIGAPGVVGGGVGDTGAAYVYVRAGTSWGVEQKLESQSVDLPHSVFDFGEAVSLTRDFALVGNPTDHHPYAGAGAAHLFERSGSRWARVSPVLRASNAYQFDYFSHAVSVSDAGAFVGAPDVRGAGYKEGLVYAYGLPANPIDRLRLDRDWSRYADILFGLIRGGPGVIIKPGSGPVPVDPEPFVDWRDLDRSVRLRLVGEALQRLATLVDDEKVATRVADAAERLKKAAREQKG